MVDWVAEVQERGDWALGSGEAGYPGGFGMGLKSFRPGFYKTFYTIPLPKD